ncbi:hypothetical protein RIF29_41852 [Crotalaria pallida]|uniref:Glycosyl hydrolase family 63 C-terminal domain-containing protein n=1 Tax=Crotalaria pallida TaxID=3830 RepID=A0AAN9HVR6_CROPI
MDLMVDSESITVGKAAIGNLLGGIGYFYGQSKIALPRIPDLKEQVDILSYWPAELYTAVPSRPGFPRGFLWDEGFHQLLIWRWDIHISLDIIGHWLDLMNIDGWIPREQILGAEALSRVPEEYVPQHPTNGNPPTLLLALSDIVSGLKDNKFTAMDRNDISLFLNHAFVRLEAWFQWFNTTQSGSLTSSYYWHGRDNKTIRLLNPRVDQNFNLFFQLLISTLSSGLDDYPRASHPSNDERHLDIRCWMFLAADCMHSIEDLLNKETKPDKNYGSTAKLLSDLDLLNQIHFDDAYGAYFDFGNHTEKVELKWREVDVGHNNTTCELVRVVLEKPELRFVPHIGYVSLNHGFWKSSLNSSRIAASFGLTMDYVLLPKQENGPYQDTAKALYTELRSNLIRNIVRNYEDTGFLWEQFDQDEGKGKGTHPFTGWTSLVVLIMAEAYGKI